MILFLMISFFTLSVQSAFVNYAIIFMLSSAISMTFSLQSAYGVILENHPGS